MFLRSMQLAFTGCLSLLPTGATGSASSAFLHSWRYRCSISQVVSVCTGRYSRAGQAQRSLAGSASLWVQGRDRCLSQGCPRRKHTSSQSLGCLDRRSSARPCALRRQSRRIPLHAAICQQCFSAVARCSGCLDQSRGKGKQRPGASCRVPKLHMLVPVLLLRLLASLFSRFAEPFMDRTSITSIASMSIRSKWTKTTIAGAGVAKTRSHLGRLQVAI